MSLGLDYTSGPPIAALKAARIDGNPVTFVCRYVGYFSGYNLNEIATPQGKVLTPGEAKANSQAGIATVSNYEWYAARATESAASGAWDAHTANTIHLGCGGPASRPIYFSVDADVQGAQTANYFKGVANGIGLARTGAYGSKRVLQYLFDNNLISWGWQTYAWSGGLWEPRAHIQQYLNGQQLSGHLVDYDRSIKADFGQWIIGETTMPIPQGWTDSNGILAAPNGVPVHDGFRSAVENDPNFDPANLPQEAEYNANPVQYHVSDSGNGDRQTFRDTVYWWTPKYGVVVEKFPGLELDATYKLIAAQQAEIDALKANPPAPMPVDTSTVIADIHAIADGIAPLVAKALVDISKL